jgi:hypothetical protein
VRHVVEVHAAEALLIVDGQILDENKHSNSTIIMLISLTFEAETEE